MFIFCMILLITKIYSEDKDENDYLYLNKQFNSIWEDNNSFNFYFGSQLLYFSIINNEDNSFSSDNKTYQLKMEFNKANKNIEVSFNNTNYSISKKDIIHFNESTLFFIDNKSQIIAISFINQTEELIKNAFSLNLTINKSYISMIDFRNEDALNETSYGEIIFIKYTFIPYNILILGFFIIINGSIHKVLGIVFHVTLFIYFFIKDIIEIFGGFAYSHLPLFLLLASLITGILFSFYIHLQDNKFSRYREKVLKASYGILFCFFSFKSIFYYFTFFTGLNKIVYFIFLIIFTLCGICLGLGFASFLYEKLDKYSKLLFISCSAVSGSFFIVKSLGYIVGGYYSDILVSKYNLDFDGVCKGKVFLYLFIQILLIIGSVLYQIKNEKYRDEEDIESLMRTSDLSTVQSFGTKTSNINTEEESLQSINNNESNSNQNDEEGDDDNDINDQED